MIYFSAILFLIGLFFGMADAESMHLFAVTKFVALVLLGLSVIVYLCGRGVADEKI